MKKPLAIKIREAVTNSTAGWSERLYWPAAFLEETIYYTTWDREGSRTRRKPISLINRGTTVRGVVPDRG